ncbi:hypothetical protein A987_07384, partial [Pseudomonas syringae BRIP34881]
CTDDLVGASLLAKTVFQLMHFRRLCSPFREQARSHRAVVFFKPCETLTQVRVVFKTCGLLI